MPPRLDLTGQRFGRLVALSPTRDRYRIMWSCRCDCGAESTVTVGDLRHGATTSCGCWRRESSSLRSRTHGDSRRNPKEYRIWRNIKTRCTNDAVAGYVNYGARGISMCDRWNESYEAFLEDMGRSPPGTSIDRIDNSRGYEPGNCRWATATTQARNTRTYKTNKVGFRGVCAQGRRFRAQIMANGKKFGLGTYDTLDQAVAARLAGEERLWCGGEL